MLQTIARMFGWTPLPVAAASTGAEIAASPPPGLAVVRDRDVGMPAALDAGALRARNLARATEIARRNRNAADR